jgi:diguanylate cyclase (GGDEF)-like protein
VFHFQNRYIRKDGRVVDIQWSAHWSERDGVRIAVAHDVTELKRAEAMQAALLAISEAAHTESDMASLFARIHRIVERLLPAANCFVALRDAAGEAVEFPYFVDEHDAAPAPVPLHEQTLSNHVIRTGAPLLLTPETRADLPAALQACVGHEAAGWLGVPLATPAGVIGALVVQSYDAATRYTAHDLQLLQFVSAQVAAAIERTRHRTWLAYLAHHDALTGLANRSSFHDRLAQVSGARSDGQPLALLYLDLDGFKRVNDEHGHALGDQLLREAGARIRRCVRHSDAVARLGGDEFVVMLHGTAEAADALQVGEHLRAALEAPYELDGRTVRVSASIGIALQPDGAERRPLLQHADNAMYAAKRQGGNRLSVAGSE